MTFWKPEGSNLYQHKIGRTQNKTSTRQDEQEIGFIPTCLAITYGVNDANQRLDCLIRIT